MNKPLSLLRVGIIICLLFTNWYAHAQSLQKGWDAFFANNRAEARAQFTTGTQTPATEAWLGLSLLDQMDKPDAEAFNHFKNFYSQSKTPAPYVFALWLTGSINSDFGKKSDSQIAFLREIASHKDYDGSLTAMAYAMLGKHFENAKQFDKADAEYKNIGSIDAWQIAGEYENISTSGFDKTYETLTHPEADATFTNKNGVKSSWFTLPYIKHSKWIDFTYYSNAYNTINFAQSFVKSDADVEAQLRIGVSGSVKVWVNDKLILSEADERNNDLDSYIQTIKLNKGYNRILVQIGESYASESNFLVRLTDAQGKPLSGISCVAKAQPYTKETTYESKKVENFAISYFEDLLAKNPNNFIAQLMAASSYLEFDRTYEARRIYADLLKKYPTSTYLNTQLIQVFSKSQNRTGTETVKEAIKTNDPDCTLALILKYNELIEQKAYDKAEEVINKLEKLQPDQAEFIIASRIDLADYNKKQDELVKLALDAYNKYPENSNFTRIKYYIEINLNKNTEAGINVLKNYVATHDNFKMAKLLTEAYFNAGKADKGLKVLKDEIKLDSIGVGIYEHLGYQYYKLQQYDKAADCYLKCLTIAPSGADYYTSLGKIYETSNQKAKAIDYYQKGLAYEPNNYTTIKSLRKLQNQKDVFSYFEEPDVTALIKNAPKASDYPDDNIVYLDDEVQKVVYKNGGSEERHYVITKMLTQKGIENWKEYSIGYDNWQNLVVETAEVIKANGSKVPAERNENQLVFTNLEVGDVINISYKIENYYKGKLAPHFFDSFYFSHGSPYVKAKYSLLISKDKNFTYKFSQKDIAPQKTDADEFTMYVWQNTNQQALTYEDKMMPLADVGNILYLTSLPDWTFVSNWYNDLASAKARTNYEVKEVIKELIGNQPNLSTQQKVELIYNYITDNISYSSVSFRQSGLIPQNPSTVLNTRIGDCKDVSTLFVAMCKEAGVTAQLVLVKTRDNGLNTLPVPSIDFNHCMAKVNLNNTDYYIELTNKYLPFKSVFTESLNSTILDIGPGVQQGTKYLNPAVRKANNVNRNVNITLRDKDLVISEHGYKTAALAGDVRENYGDLSQKDRIKKVKSIFSNAYPDNEIINLTYKNLALTDKANKDTVYRDLDYELRNATKSIAGMTILSLPWSNKVVASDLQIVTPRYSGIDITQLYGLDNEVETITLNLPAGKALVEPFKPVVLNNDAIDYSLTPKALPGKLVITRKLTVKKGNVPADKVAAFNDFFKKVVEADNAEIAIK